MKKINLIFLILLLLILLQCCSQDNPSKQSQIPHFELRDIKGNTVTSDQFNNGYALFYFPSNDEPDIDIYSLIEEYEEEHETPVNKLAILQSDCDAQEDWSIVVDKSLNFEFRKLTKYRNTALFDNGRLKFAENLFEEKGIPSFLLKYHSALSGYEKTRDYIEENRPEDFFDAAEIFSYCSAKTQSERNLIVLVFTNIWTVCKERLLLIKYFNDKLEDSDFCSGFVLVDDGISPSEIETLRHNLDLSVFMESMSDKELRALKNLQSKHFGAKFNILLMFDQNGEFVDGMYVTGGCPGIDTLF